MKKFVLGPLLAALAAFILGFIWWGLPPQLAYKTLGSVPDPSASALAIGQLFPASGAYLLPSPLDGEETMKALAARGPSIEVHIRKEPFTGADMGKTMAFGFLHLFVISLVLSIMLCGLAGVFKRWTCRVRFCAGIGLLVMLCDLGQVIWWKHALGWTLAIATYDFLMFVVIGLVLAKFVTPKETAATPA